MLAKAAAVERHSEHPIAQAIVRAAKDQKQYDSVNFVSHTGKAVSATIEGQVVLVGQKSYLEAEGVQGWNTLIHEADAERVKGSIVVFVSSDKKLLGYIAVADPIKKTTPEAIEKLHQLGLKIVMMTGDHPLTANAAAKPLHIDEVYAQINPEEKLKKLNLLKNEGKLVAMAGDGINDAPALAAADVGIAMGTGTDVAMESAGITLIKGDLNGIVNAIQMSRAIMKNIRENLFLAFIYNILSVPIAAGLLYPFFGFLLNPMIASAAMSLSSVSVIFNALRLKYQGGRRDHS